MSEQRTGYNNLRLIAYSSGSTPVSASGLDRAKDLTFRTFYPGGIYADLTFFVPMDVVTSLTGWQVRTNQRIQAWNGLTVCWEGKITAISPTFDAGAEGATVTALGYWSQALMTQLLHKPWADTRYEQNVWRWQTAASGSEKASIDRTGRMRITPKAVAWTTNQYARVECYAPTGQTFKRVTFTYDFKEAAQNWTFRLVDITNGAVEWSVTADGSSTADITLTNPTTCARIGFDLLSGVNQTPAADGTQYGEITALTVYTETGSINLTEVAKDILPLATDLSADVTEIDSNTYSLVPFVADPPESLADILDRAASFGDSSFNSWACCVRASSLSSDDKPVLCVEQQPALTDTEYVVRLDDTNVQSGITFEQDISTVINDLIVGYTDGEGVQRWITSTDDANLKDATSIAAYGTRQAVLQLDTESSATATNFARRYLAKYKDAQWRASGDLVVKGYIRNKAGARVPVSQIQSGQRVRIDNWLNDLSGTGLTFLITVTNYDDASESCSLSLGKPDNLDIYLSRLTKRER